MTENENTYPEVRTIFDNIINCQKVSPYTGWDIPKLRKVFETEIKPFLEKIEGPHNRDIGLLKALSENFQGNQINITSLNKSVNHIRARQGLPSIEDLNPDIKERRENFYKATNLHVNFPIKEILNESTMNFEDGIVSIFNILSTTSKIRVSKRINDIVARLSDKT